MRTFFSISLIGLLLSVSACCGKTQCEKGGKEEIINKSDSMNNCKKVSDEDLNGIRKALDLYVQASIEGDSHIARPAFAEGATISHAENDSLVCLPIQALYDYYDETGKQSASYEVSDCNVAGDVAMVRIESVFGEAKFTDMFTLVKDGSEWKIVSKIFTVK